MSPEFTIIVLNVLVLSVAYLIFYPKYCGANIKKLMIWDMLYSLFIIGICYMLFGGKHIVFDAIAFETNWFVFCMSVYILVEMLFFVWYMKKYNIKFD